jgi:hypothetical protein
MTICSPPYLLHYPSSIETFIRTIHLDITEWLHGVYIIHAILIFDLRFIRWLGTLIPWE